MKDEQTAAHLVDHVVPMCRLRDAFVAAVPPGFHRGNAPGRQPDAPLRLAQRPARRRAGGRMPIKSTGKQQPGRANVPECIGYVDRGTIMRMVLSG